jgi:sodium-dependent dicarboxylate transporter 2/3/5
MKTFHFWIGIALFVLFCWIEIPSQPQANEMAAITILMAYWWFTECIHFTVTSLLPLVLFPILRIESTKNTATEYMDSIIFLFIGGFFFAFALQKWNLHQRLALILLTKIGKSLSSILYGILFACFFLSMWISNTATVLLLLPMVLAILKWLEALPMNNNELRNIEIAFLIGLSYASTMGGMATLVGTPTNMIFFREFTKHFPHIPMSFLTWFFLCFPVAMVLFFCLCFYLRKFLLPNRKIILDKNLFIKELNELGAWKKEEKIIAMLFLVTVILWFTRSDIDFGNFHWYGWGNLLFKNDWVNDTTVVMGTSLLLFFIPDSQKKSSILTWEDTKQLPFDIILLFGGGFALAKGFETTRLSEWLAYQINGFIHFPSWIFLLLLVMIITIISEFASNVACIQLLLPIIITLQAQNQLDPLTFTLPATLAASLGFMMPVATAPNTIVYGTQKIPIQFLLLIGLIMDLIGILFVSLWTYYWILL